MECRTRLLKRQGTSPGRPEPKTVCAKDRDCLPRRTDTQFRVLFPIAINSGKNSFQAVVSTSRSRADHLSTGIRTKGDAEHAETRFGEHRSADSGFGVAV